MRRWAIIGGCVTLSTLAFAQGHVPPKPIPYVTEDLATFTFRTVEDNTGGWYTIWTHGLAPDHFELQGQHFDGMGMPIWSQQGIRLVTDLHSARSWDAFIDAKGGLLLSWTEDGKTQVQRFNADGKALWQSGYFMVSSSSFSQEDVRGVSDGAGGAYVVWSERRFPDRSVLMMQHLNPFGAPLWGVQGQRVSLRASDQQRPAIAFDGSLGAIVTWNDSRQNASQLQTERLDYQGNRLWGVEGIPVTAPAGLEEDRPHLAPVGRGSAAFAWATGASGKRHILLQILDGKGSLLWRPEGVAVSLVDSDQWAPVLFGDGEGGLWIAWIDYRNGIHWQVFSQHLLANGQAAGHNGELAVAPTNADQGQLNLADSGRGGIWVTWIDNRSGAAGVYGQEVDGLGARMRGSQGTTIAEGFHGPSRPQIVPLAPGEASVTWAEESPKGHWALFFKRLSKTP